MNPIKKIFKKAPVVITLTGVTILSTLFLITIGFESQSLFYLKSEILNEPLEWYRFLTYPLANPYISFSTLISYGAVILLGLCTEKFIPKKPLVILTIISLYGYGLAWFILHQIFDSSSLHGSILQSSYSATSFYWIFGSIILMRTSDKQNGIILVIYFIIFLMFIYDVFNGLLTNMGIYSILYCVIFFLGVVSAVVMPLIQPTNSDEIQKPQMEDILDSTI